MQCAVSSRWIPLGMPRPTTDGEPDMYSVRGCSVQSTRRLPERCGSAEGAPVTTRVSQAESLTPSCRLNAFPNSQWCCEALNPTDLPGCVLLQNFERACSVSQWSWADCMRMRHLAGSPPEQRGLNPGKVSLNFTGKRVCCSSGPWLKGMIRTRRNLVVDWNAKQMNCAVLKKGELGELHSLKAEWQSLGKTLSFCMLVITSPEGSNFCSSPPLQLVPISVWI